MIEITKIQSLFGVEPLNIQNVEPEVPTKANYIGREDDYITALVDYELQRARFKGIEFDYGVGSEVEQLQQAIENGYKLSKHSKGVIEFENAEDDEGFESDSSGKSKSSKKRKKEYSPPKAKEKKPRKNARSPSVEREGKGRRGKYQPPIYSKRKEFVPKQCPGFHSTCPHDDMYVGIKKGQCECRYYDESAEICHGKKCPKNQAIILSADEAANQGKEICDCYIPKDIKAKRAAAKAKERADKKQKNAKNEEERRQQLAQMSSAERRRLEEEDQEEREDQKKRAKEQREQKKFEKQQKEQLYQQAQQEEQGINIAELFQGGRRSRKRSRSRKSRKCYK
jgi:hypothetical protein